MQSPSDQRLPDQRLPDQRLNKFLGVIFLTLMVVMFVTSWEGYDASIEWNVTAGAESESFTVHQFTKGPFTFEIPGNRYALAESYSAGPITRSYQTDLIFLCFMALGLSVLLASLTYLPRWWFLGSQGALVFFLIYLGLEEFGILGVNNLSIARILLIASFLVPGYLFHEYLKSTSYVTRLITYLVIFIGLPFGSGADLLPLQEQLIAGSYYGIYVLALIFILIISEEIIFLILFVVTRSKGGQQNQVHFTIFSLIYLVFIGAYYANKASLINLEISFFNPYVLLAISAITALWSLKYKAELYAFLVNPHWAHRIYLGLGIVVFAFMGLSFVRGNDPVYESLHYFIIYAHVGFGSFFFLYIIFNFINPLIKGLQIYKIVYTSINFPYASARIGGMVAVLGFFLLAENQPYFLLRAGAFNYQGASAQTQNESRLAQEYFREGSIYGYDNHFSNYQLGYHALQKGNIPEANYRFYRATTRYPSAQAFVNTAGTFAMSEEATRSLTYLKSGLLLFPNNAPLKNNLGLTYLDMGKVSEAKRLFESAGNDPSWTSASTVNVWNIPETYTSTKAESDFVTGNLAIKTNVLSSLLSHRATIPIPFDTTQIAAAHSMHRLTYLINSTWYFRSPKPAQYLEKSLGGVLDEQIYRNANLAMATSLYLQGEVNQAIRALDKLLFDVSSTYKGEYLNLLGLMALEQNALGLALEFFERSIASGYDEALLNKAACLLEMGNYDDAAQFGNYLISVDSIYETIHKDINRIVNASTQEVPTQADVIYYRFLDLDKSLWPQVLEQMSVEQIEVTWRKIQQDLLLRNDLEQLAVCLDLFKNQIKDNTKWMLADLYLNRKNIERLKSSHPFAQAIKTNDPERLYEMASKNALNEPEVTLAADVLMEMKPDAAYQILVEAMDINKTSISLRQKYIMSAAAIGLVQYAEDALTLLQTMMTPKDYQQFLQKFQQHKAQLEGEQNW